MSQFREYAFHEIRRHLTMFLKTLVTTYNALRSLFNEENSRI